MEVFNQDCQMVLNQAPHSSEKHGISSIIACISQLPILVKCVFSSSIQACLSETIWTSLLFFPFFSFFFTFQGVPEE